MKTLIHINLNKPTIEVVGTYAKNKQYRRARAQHWGTAVGSEAVSAEQCEHTYTHTPIMGYRVRSHVKIPTAASGLRVNDVYLLITHEADKPIPRKTLNAIVKEAVAELKEAYTD